MAEDRERFQKLVTAPELKQPANASARNEDSAVMLAREVGFPLVVRPSYVLGGRAMEVVFNEDDLRQYMTDAVKVSNDSPVLLDRFFDLAIEVDVDAVSDGEDVLIGGIMEHIEQAGVHSGDSGCSLPPTVCRKRSRTNCARRPASSRRRCNVVGLMNIQFAIQGGVIYVLEVNPRASRTVPFVSKATGVPLAKVAARVMTGKSLASQGQHRGTHPAVLFRQGGGVPVRQVPGSRSDPGSGDEIHRRGDGHRATFGEAYAKAQAASGVVLPTRGLCFISVRDRDKPGAVPLAQMLIERGFEIAATGGTARSLDEAGVTCRRVNKVREGRPHVVDMIKNDEVALIVNTTEGKQAVRESRSIRREAVARRVTYYTTVAGARATCDALDHLGDIEVNRLQDLHKELPCVKRTPMTLRGAERLRAELKKLKSEDRPNVIKAIAEARATAICARTPSTMRRASSRASSRAASTNRAPARNAEIIDVTKLSASGRVVFGATRGARGSGRRRTVVYQLVGDDEADIKEGLLSVSSPIARALIGKSRGRGGRCDAPGRHAHLRDPRPCATCEPP